MQAGENCSDCVRTAKNLCSCLVVCLWQCCPKHDGNFPLGNEVLMDWGGWEHPETGELCSGTGRNHTGNEGDGAFCCHREQTENRCVQALGLFGSSGPGSSRSKQWPVRKIRISGCSSLPGTAVTLSTSGNIARGVDSLCWLGGRKCGVSQGGVGFIRAEHGVVIPGEIVCPL